MDIVSGTYFYNNDYKKPITLTIDENNNVVAKSSYWPNQNGKFFAKIKTIKFNDFGLAYFKDNILYFENDSQWKKESRKSLLFVGANDMKEIDHYVKDYFYGIFIEPYYPVYLKLLKNLNETNTKHGTNYIAVNKLITNDDDKDYIFNIFSNDSHSSSIFEPNPETFKWDVSVNGKINLKSTRLNTLLKDYPLNKFDAVIDVQGAELEVLKSLDSYINQIEKLTIEVSKQEFYKGAVLFDDLNKYLIEKGFELQTKDIPDHGDVIYHKK